MAAATAVRAMPRPRVQPPKREAPNERPDRRRRRWPSPLLPSPQELPVLRTEGAEDRLQGHAPAAALRFGARHDRAEPTHRRFDKEAACAGACDKACPIPFASSLRSARGKAE